MTRYSSQHGKQLWIIIPKLGEPQGERIKVFLDSKRTGAAQFNSRLS